MSSGTARGRLVRWELVRHSGAACEERSLGVVVIQSDFEAQSTHFLLVVVKNHEVSVNSIVLCDQMEQRNTDISESHEILPFHLAIESISINILTVDVVSDLKHSSLGLEVVENLRIHLDL